MRSRRPRGAGEGRMPQRGYLSIGYAAMRLAEGRILRYS